ncbi:MAG: hypothetical protein KDB35_03225 [Acidimicrobiales bacterium]|nr:hypothetical protein [Acidimicrobiales bacterium]MCB1015225.1 hypothetical protein [Acidimicrobiales bacterium]
MPLFVAAVVVARRRRAGTAPVPVPAPPLWWLLVDELTVALRSAWARVAGRR